MNKLLRVLLVEDSGSDAELVLAALSRQGYEPDCERVQNATEMDSALARREWDIVLCDYEMPGFDALSALRLLRARDRDVPLLIVSGTINEETAVNAIKEGVADYLLKDRLARLGSAINQAMAQSRLRREHRQAEREIQRQAAFAHFNPNPVLELSAAGEIIYCNVATEEMTRALGQTSPIHILPPKYATVVQQCLKTNRPLLRLETQFGGRTISWSFFPVRSSQAVHCYGGDITERLKLEQQFRQSQKMEAIGQLSGGVAHDFNNLLTVIIGNLGLVLTSGKVDPENAGFLEEISQAASRAANLTRQLLTFSRQQVMQQQDLDLNEVVDNIAKMVRRLLEENVEIQLGYVSQALPIHADAGMLEQVILNLCINARDAMPHGGRLVLQTSAMEFDETMGIQGGEVRAGLFARLAVTDTGSGIAPENLRHVFEPFFTTKEVGKGTGLGLASVYGIVEQHHGWVTVDSEVGRGSTFCFYLPVVTAVAAKNIPAVPVAEVPGGSETILLVEDDMAVQMVAHASLTRLGYRVLLANTGHEAIRIWNEKKSEIQLVLTDMVMPEGMSGMELGRHFKAERPDLKLLIMSGYDADVAGTNFPQAGPGAFLGKPFELSVLAEAVRRCLDVPAGDSERPGVPA